MMKNMFELLEQADRVLADVQVLDGHLLLANKSATQGGKARAIELYMQDAARFVAKWLPDAGIEVKTHAEATAAHMVLMHLAIDSYRSNMLAMLDFMKAKN